MSIRRPRLFPDAEAMDELDASKRSVIDALLLEHQSIRDDMRGAEALQAAFAGVVVALLAGIFALLIQKGSDGQEGYVFAGALWVWGLVPFAPLAFAAYGVMIARDMVIRSYYARIVERELHRHLPDAILVDVKRRSGSGSSFRMPIPSWGHLQTLADAPRTRDRLYVVVYMLPLLVGVIGLVVVFALCVARCDNFWWEVVCSALWFTSLAALIAVALSNIVSGYKRWSRLVQSLGAAIDKPLVGPREKSKPLLPWAYLLLPRPDDLSKCLIMLLAALVGLLASDWAGWREFGWWSIAFLVMFEIVVYPARYMWNDMRDLAKDQLPQNQRLRARCPVSRCRDGGRYAKHAVFVCAFLRFALGVAFGTWLVLDPGLRQMGWLFLAALLALVLYSIGYEWQRDATNRRSPRRSIGWLPLWLFVAMGGCLRVLLGMYLGLGQARPVSLALAGALGLCTYLVLVTMTWALEATTGAMVKPHLRPLMECAFPKRPGGERVKTNTYGMPEVRMPAPQDEPPAWRRLLLRKPPPSEHNGDARGEPVTPRTPFLALPAWRPAPWDYFAWLGIVLGVSLGTLLAVESRAGTGLFMLTLPVGVLVGWVIVRLKPSCGFLVVVAGAAYVFIVTRVTVHDWSCALAALVAVLMPAGFYLNYRRSSYVAISADLFKALAHLATTILSSPYVWAFKWFTKPRPESCASGDCPEGAEGKAPQA